ncbi:MAG: small subunit ribosomal protein S5 [Planctomycetota bacterium]|jgi:small subunit ribosomal protein S5
MSETQPTTKDQATPAPAAVAPRSGGYRGSSTGSNDRRPSSTKRNFRKTGRKPREYTKPEYDQKIISIRRVTRVMAGGRRFSFSVVMVIGDRKGSVGVGIGKATDTALAIGKAINNAKKNMVKLQLNDKRSIDHGVEAKYNSARISMRPNYGRGVVAGSSLRIVIELAGIHDITGRVLSRSKNKLNNAQATLLALSDFIIARGADALKKKPETPVASRPSEIRRAVPSVATPSVATTQKVEEKKV